MAYSNVVKTKRDGLISICDDSGFAGSNTLDLAFEPGDFSMNAPQENRLNFLDRGRLVSSVRYGDDQALTGSFSVYFRDTTDAAAATLMDILNQSGYVSTAPWVGTLGANAEVFTCDLRLTIEGTDHGDAADHTITITDVSFDYTMAEGDPNVITVNWQSHTEIRPTLA
jgi:hypothetical protein